MKNLFKEAHKMTREIKAKYSEVDYQVQFGLCLSYLLNKEEEKKMIKKLAEEKIRKFAKDEKQMEKNLARLAEISEQVEDLDRAEQLEMLKEHKISIKFREPIRLELYIEDIAEDHGITVAELRKQMEQNGEI